MILKHTILEDVLWMVHRKQTQEFYTIEERVERDGA
jgi:hypothetical protein